MKFKPSPFDHCTIKNRRATYRPSTEHRYNFRSRTTTPDAQHVSSHGTNFKHLVAQHLQGQHYCSQVINHIYDLNGKRQSINKRLRSNDSQTKWSPALNNKWVILAQGNDNSAELANNIVFIPYHEVPIDKK